MCAFAGPTGGESSRKWNTFSQPAMSIVRDPAVVLLLATAAPAARGEERNGALAEALRRGGGSSSAVVSGAGHSDRRVTRPRGIAAGPGVGLHRRHRRKQPPARRRRAGAAFVGSVEARMRARRGLSRAASSVLVDPAGHFWAVAEHSPTSPPLRWQRLDVQASRRSPAARTMRPPSRVSPPREAARAGLCQDGLRDLTISGVGTPPPAPTRPATSTSSPPAPAVTPPPGMPRSTRAAEDGARS